MEYLVFLGVLVAFFILWCINGVRQERQKRLRFEEKLKQLEGKLPDKQYDPEYFLFKGKNYKQKDNAFGIDEITWNDLSMDEVFKRMDYTYSAAGEETLYRILRTPSFDQSELEHRGELIRFFETHKKERIDLQLLYAKIGRTGKYSIYEYLDYLQALERTGNTKEYAVLIAMALSVGIMFINVGYGLLLFGLLLVYNMGSYLKTKGRIGPYITTFSYIIRMLQNAQMLIKADISELSREFERLSEIEKSFHSFQKGAFIVTRDQNVSGSPLDVLWDYICMIFHIDLIKFNLMHDEVAKKHSELKEMFDLIGYIEAMISIALFRKSLNYYTEPVFTDHDTILQIKDGYHPLLKEPVSNSIKCQRGVLLTGSNASGKSTFLKTIALNAILGQTIYTCMASRYEAGMFRVYSSMSLRDDLIEGDSYFIVEIKAIKRILDACNQSDERPVLMFVDEVLRGTNTVERIAASTEILKALQRDNTICFAATHDLELTKLLQGTFDNYHFEEKLEDGDVTFAYQLLSGEATTRNAIELLRVLGFDDTIVEKAHENASRYMEREEIWKAVSMGKE